MGASLTTTKGQRLVLGLAPVAVLFLLYVPSIGIPYFWDDLYILNWTHSAPLSEILTRVGWGRFRLLDRLPLPYSFDVFGPHGATVVHGLSLALGTVNVALAGRAVRELIASDMRRWGVSCFAALGLALVPLSCRVLAGAAAIAHLAVTTATSTALVCVAAFRRTGRRRWLLGSRAMAASAPLAAESGVVSGFLIACLVRVAEFPRFTQRVGWIVGGHIGISGLAGIVVASVTHRGAATASTASEALSRAAFLLQALTYPVAPLAARYAGGVGHSALAAAALHLGTLVIVGAALIRSEAWRPFTYGLVWHCLTALAPAYALTSDYLRNAPHVYSFGSVGAAIAWSAAWARALALTHAHDMCHMILAQPPADGCSTTEIGLFYPSTGDRVPVFDADGHAFPNAAVTLTVRP
jgi:hypothetical protein